MRVKTQQFHEWLTYRAADVDAQPRQTIPPLNIAFSLGSGQCQPVGIMKGNVW